MGCRPGGERFVPIVSLSIVFIYATVRTPTKTLQPKWFRHIVLILWSIVWYRTVRYSKVYRYVRCIVLYTVQYFHLSLPAKIKKSTLSHILYLRTSQNPCEYHHYLVQFEWSLSSFCVIHLCYCEEVMDDIVHVSFDLWEIEFHRNYWDVIVMSPYSLFCRIRHVYL